jgi:protein crumbs
MGPRCERPSSPCLPNPCHNNGTCLEMGVLGGYTCACRDHFTGRNCERHLGWCEENVCLNGATCVGGSTANRGHCVCRAGWTGMLCGVRVAPSCDLSPCVDGGTCTPAPGTTDGYVCRCQSRPGVALDKNCAAPNPCETAPCPGTHVCVSREVSYTCECLKPGCQPWTGGGHENSTVEPATYNNMSKCFTLAPVLDLE